MKEATSSVARSSRSPVGGSGDVRIGPILAIPATLSALSVQPAHAFAQAGIDPRLFRDSESRMTFEALGRLLEVCVALTGCPHFGLTVGARFDLKDLSTLGHLMRHSPTVREALCALMLNLHLQDRAAAVVLLTPDPSSVVLGYSLYRHDSPATVQIQDAAIAIGYRMLGELCGPGWKPLRVQFSHGKPASAAPYRRLFRSHVMFDAEVSGIAFDSSWLERTIDGADTTLHANLSKAIRRRIAGGAPGFVEQVQAALHQMLLGGAASSETVARLFAIHPRTLRRRLKDEGTSLTQLTTQARFELARHLLRHTELSVTEISVALQYADPNVFSRAFRSWANLSPTQWRARERDSTGAGLDPAEAMR